MYRECHIFQGNQNFPGAGKVVWNFPELIKLFGCSQLARKTAMIAPGLERIVRTKCRELEEKTGLSEDKCLWAGCSRKALKGPVFCSWHYQKEELESDIRSATDDVYNHYLSVALKKSALL